MSLVIGALSWPNGAVAVTPPITGGEMVLVRSTGGVSATFLGGIADFSVDVYLDSPANSLGVIFNNQTTAPGTQIALGTFAAGAELVFRIRVNNTGDDFYTGPPSRNADGIWHALIHPEYGVDGTMVGFEDRFGGGDSDYDDVEFALTNTTTPADADGDGIPDLEEPGDANGDGIPDASQDTVASLLMIQGYPSPLILGPQVIVYADPSALDQYIKDLEAAMALIGDDAQLANVDLQNSLQKVQQTLQMISNVSKMMHDTTMAIIRKIGSRSAPVQLAGFGGLPAALVQLAAPTTEPTVIAMLFPPGASSNSYVNFGPTADNPVPHAYEFLFDGQTGARFVPGGVLLYFVDGQRGDHDLTANGQVTTQGGGVLVGGQARLTAGYWKKHATAWPLASLVLGDETYKQAELLALLDKSTAKDASLNLAAQLIVAKLNIAHGSPAESISATIEDADSLLAAFNGKLPYNVTKPSSVRSDMLGLAKLLEAYNSGL